MTQNQLEYWKLQEEIRHNLAEESEKVRSNRATEMIGFGELSEKTRHNVVSEGINVSSLEETGRHNRAGEYLSGQQIQVNREVEQAKLELEQARLEESARHNLQVEVESQRHNAYEENIKMWEEKNANQRKMESQVEAQRHNKAQEDEAHRHNVRTEKLDEGKLVNGGISTASDTMKWLAPFMLQWGM